jgi:hypothetical protein
MFIVYIDKESTDGIKMRWLVGKKDTMTMWNGNQWTTEMPMLIGKSHFKWILNSPELFDILHYEE